MRSKRQFVGNVEDDLRDAIFERREVDRIVEFIEYLWDADEYRRLCFLEVFCDRSCGFGECDRSAEIGEYVEFDGFAKSMGPRKKNSHSQYVIAMENHKPLTKSSYKSMWKLIERELPEAHVTAHILRHTYITRLFEAGLDIKEVQYLAGHSTVDMTLRVYTHYDRRSREAQTAEKVRNALRTS